MSARRIVLQDGADLDGFRRAVRRARRATGSRRSTWFRRSRARRTCSAQGVGCRAPRRSPCRGAVADLVGLVVCHRDPERYALLYGLVWRVLQRRARALLEVRERPARASARSAWREAVRRDLHKMHAFLRFRRLEADGAERFVAWFEPEHFILEATAPFFVDRFRSLDWTILTPIGSLRWDRERLALRPAGAPRGRAGERRLRGGLARLLRERVQPGPREPGRPCGPRCRRSTGATCRRRRRSAALIQIAPRSALPR